MLEKYYYVYILTNKKFGTLYVGITGNLVKRVYIHKIKHTEGFTKKYSLDTLVYYEIYSDVNKAILREKQLKKWNRQWKINLIEQTNPQWIDLYYGLA